LVDIDMATPELARLVPQQGYFDEIARTVSYSAKDRVGSQERVR